MNVTVDHSRFQSVLRIHNVKQTVETINKNRKRHIESTLESEIPSWIRLFHGGNSYPTLTYQFLMTHFQPIKYCIILWNSYDNHMKHPWHMPSHIFVSYIYIYIFIYSSYLVLWSQRSWARSPALWADGAPNTRSIWATDETNMNFRIGISCRFSRYLFYAAYFSERSDCNHIPGFNVQVDLRGVDLLFELERSGTKYICIYIYIYLYRRSVTLSLPVGPAGPSLPPCEIMFSLSLVISFLYGFSSLPMSYRRTLLFKCFLWFP